MQPNMYSKFHYYDELAHWHWNSIFYKDQIIIIQVSIKPKASWEWACKLAYMPNKKGQKKHIYGNESFTFKVLVVLHGNTCNVQYVEKPTLTSFMCIDFNQLYWAWDFYEVISTRQVYKGKLA